MKRRNLSLLVMAGILLSGIGGLTAQIRTRAIAGDPVMVTGGKVAGNQLANGVKTYFGIPFAAPPTGALRWKEPQPVTPWSGVREAVALPPACMQIGISEPISEDCLYLNLWSPAQAKPGTKLPVVVYIYGGGFARSVKAL